MVRQKVLIITHFNFTAFGPIHGPAHSITSYLEKKKIPYTLIGHPLYSGKKSFIEIFNGKKIHQKEFGTNLKLPLIVKSFLETLQTLLKTWRSKNTLIISIDPLNTIPALILKKNRKTKKLIFYTVDYAEKRFENPVLNFIYHLLDRLSIFGADFVWNVSTRIRRKRKKLGLKDGKNFFVPNTPRFREAKSLPESKVDRFNIMMVSGLTHRPIFSMVLASLRKLSKKYPKIKLTIIGGGPYEHDLKGKVGKMNLSKYVEFMGQLEHRTLLETLPKGGVGLALYTKDFPWTYYGDSMKAREYLASGLPVIISNFISTAENVKEARAGIVIRPREEELSAAIRRFFDHKDFWANGRKNAISLSKRFDLDKILDKTFKKAFEG